jgi:hypothetical protein
MRHQERVIVKCKTGARANEPDHQRDKQKRAGGTDLKRRAKRLHLVDVLRQLDETEQDVSEDEHSQ